MARSYDIEKVKTLINTTEKYAHYHGILDCRILLFLSEYFIAKFKLHKSIVGISFSEGSEVTIQKMVAIFNATMFNGISLSYTINTDKKTLVSKCEKKPVAVSTAKNWLKIFDEWDGKKKDHFLSEIDRVTYFILKKPFISESFMKKMQDSIGKERRRTEGEENYYFYHDYSSKGWNSYILSKYLQSKDHKHKYSIETCRAALKRVYIVFSGTQLPTTNATILAKNVVDILNDKDKGNVYARLVELAKNHNIQDLINTISRGKVFLEKMSILTWYPDGNKIIFKYETPGASILSNYFDFDAEESIKNPEILMNALMLAVGKSSFMKTQLLILNRRDFLAPYIANIFNKNKKNYDFVSESVMLLDFL